MSDGGGTMDGAESRPGRKRNHALWLGPLTAFAGAVSYFQVFVSYPVLRDFPWVNLPVVLFGVYLSGLGLWRAWARRAVYRGRILGVLGLGVSLALAGLFHFYVFYFSYQMPPASLAAAMEVAPDFELTAQDGKSVKLSGFRGKKVVLTFYRGHW